MLGAVGAYDWAGGAFVYGADGKVAFVNASEGAGGASDAYLGEDLGSWAPQRGLCLAGGLGTLMGVSWWRASPRGCWSPPDDQGAVGHPRGFWGQWLSPLGSWR